MATAKQLSAPRNMQEVLLVSVLQPFARLVPSDESTDVTACAMCRNEDVCTEPGNQTVRRPVIKVPGRILTRINPHKMETTMIMHIRPGWEDLRNFIRGPPGDKGGCASPTATSPARFRSAVWQ